MDLAILLPALLALVLLVLLLRQRRRIARLEAQIAFREVVAGRLGLLTVTYDVARDEARLSRDCAKLFGLPDVIDALSGRPKDAMFPSGATLSPITRCLAAIQSDRPGGSCCGATSSRRRTAAPRSSSARSATSRRRRTRKRASPPARSSTGSRTCTTRARRARG